MVEASCPPLLGERWRYSFTFSSCYSFLRRAEVLVGKASTRKNPILDSFEKADSGSGLRMFFVFALAEKRGVTTSE